ncbi:MAG: alpha-L-fucosidase [Herbinix sp.]|jgi:alpha-L-fucosidase 2|nr:alpha-L-fucosidase [Herbinix sp.]
MPKQKNDNLTLWYQKPAQKWTQALPLGNGRIGAMIYGGVLKERICMNEDTLWSGYPRDTVDPEAGEYVTEAMKLTREGKADLAQNLLEDKVLGTWGQSYMPLGDIHLAFEYKGPYENYHRALDLTRAVSLVKYDVDKVTYQREYFVSAPDDGLVIRLTASERKKINFMVTVSSLLKSSVTTEGNHMILSGECPGQAAPNYVNIENPIIYSDKDEERGISFYGILKVTHQGGELRVREDSLQLMDADEATLYFTVKTSFNGYDKHPYLEGKEIIAPCIKNMKVLSSKEYQKLMDIHVEDYQSFFDRVDFNLFSNQESPIPTDERLRRFENGTADDGMYPLLFQFGRYLLISCSRPGTQAANLQGIWNEELRAPWSSNYTVNINTQMNYWPAFLCNLGELQEPLLSLVKDIRQNGKKTAEVYYNARGFCAHHNIDLWRITTPVGPRGTRGSANWGFWNMGGVWLCRHVYEQFEFTGDRQYLKNEVLPILKDASLFCLDLLTPDGQGNLWVCPSTSPENCYEINGNGYGVAATSTMTMTMVRDLFKNTIDAITILGEEDELKEQLTDILSKLYPFRIGSKGQLMEWNGDLEGIDPHHRHVSHLYGLHPANEFTYDKTPELVEACKTTLQERGDDGTGWSLGWKVCHWARLRDGDHALKLIKRQLKPVGDDAVNYENHGGTYDNLFDAHPPFQIDGNFGVCAGMAEMFLQSHEGFLHLLPALPKEWRDGHITGLVGRGNIFVSLYWQDGILQKAILKANLDGAVNIKYQDNKITCSVKAGETITLNAKLQRD